jgi:hypothetical protein
MFGTAVWGVAYAALAPLGIYEPPWQTDPREPASSAVRACSRGPARADASSTLTGVR